MSTTETSSKYSGRFWVIFAALLLFLLVFGMYLWVGGQVTGEEFSPDDFSRRHFSYNVMPIFGIQLKGVRHYSSASVLEQTLISDGWIKPVTNTPKTWHLVSDSVSDNSSSDFDANILVQLLNVDNDEDEDLWQLWTDEHPKDAKIFWPAIAELARANMYWAIPDIMNFASEFQADGKTLFTEGLAVRMSHAFFLKAESLRESGSHADAIENYSTAIKQFKCKEAFAGRAASRNAHGESGAESDEAESKNHPPYAESIKAKSVVFESSEDSDSTTDSTEKADEAVE